MFADFRVHGWNTTFFQCFHHPVLTYLQEKKEEGASPDFLWSLVALASLMRLSLLKAAHAVMSSAAYRKSAKNLKDLAQSWGWKMITVNEKMYP